MKFKFEYNLWGGSPVWKILNSWELSLLSYCSQDIFRSLFENFKENV